MRIARPIGAGVVLGCVLIAVAGVFSMGWYARAAEEFIEGQYWALIIGIDRYPAFPDDMQLVSARKDAEAVAALLRDRYGFAKDQMIELYDEAATRKGIIKALAQLKRQLTAKDSLVVYFAGQGGYEGKKGRGDEVGYWIPFDADRPEDTTAAVFNTQLRDRFADYPARHIFLISDSTFSNSLMGKTTTLLRAKEAAKDLYRDKSRWVLESGGNYPVADPADKNKNGHSIFAWHLLKALEANTKPYLFGADLVEIIAPKVSNEKQGTLPRSAPIIGAGDEGGQFIFRLLPQYQKNRGMAANEKARLEAEKAKVDAAQKELEELELQLKQAEEALKKGKKP
jgi:hypothetical protein